MNVCYRFCHCCGTEPSLHKGGRVMNCEDTTSKPSVSLKITKGLGAGNVLVC